MTKETFKLFKDVEHIPLRTYNRVVMSFNIRSDFGNAVLQDYLSNFDENERKAMMVMTMFIQKHGYETVMKSVTKDLVIDEDQLVSVA